MKQRNSWMNGTMAVALALGIGLAGCAATAGQQRSASMMGYAPPELMGLDSTVTVEMENAIRRGIRDDIFPGAVLAVGRNGYLVEHSSYGLRESGDHPHAMSTETIFDMASVSKVMGTATMTMLLIEDGKLSLDTRAADVIPAFAQQDKGNVTIRDLLVHSSGLAAYTQPALAEEKRAEGMSQAEALIEHIASLNKRYPTGENYIYSCLNFLTLARVNEAVAGESQDAFLRRRMWAPLGMVDTTYFPTEDQIARMAPTFRRGSSRPEGTIHDPLAYYYTDSQSNCAGNAGLFSTARDTALYCQMILNRGELGGVRVMKPETVDLMTAVQSNLPAFRADGEGNAVPRGLGWGVYASAPYASAEAPEGSFIGHTGYTGTYIWLDKNTNSFVVLLANSTYSSGGQSPRTQSVRRAVTQIMTRALYPDDASLAMAADSE